MPCLHFYPCLPRYKKASALRKCEWKISVHFMYDSIDGSIGNLEKSVFNSVEVTMSRSAGLQTICSVNMLYPEIALVSYS